MLQLRPISVPHSQDYLESSGTLEILVHWASVMNLWLCTYERSLLYEHCFVNHYLVNWINWPNTFFSHLISSPLILSFSLCLSRLYDGTNHRAISLTVWSGYSVTGDIVTTTTAIKPVSLITGVVISTICWIKLHLESYLSV